MAWRLARSLEVLRAEFNALAPDRSKASDGTKGDPAHAARASRHNPNNAGVVCALDITHDPDNGCDVHAIARRLVQNPHPDLEYVISNGQVARRTTGWVWSRYTGANPHTLHAHFAVGRGPDSEPTGPYDDTSPWGFGPVQEEDDMTPTQADDLAKTKYAVVDLILPAVARLELKLAVAAGQPVAQADLKALTPADLKAIAEAVADEQAERQKD